MNAEQLYEQLRLRGVELWREGKMLRFRAAEEVLSRELVTALRKHKQELIALLGQDAPGGSASSAVECPSWNQQALYFLHLAAPNSPAYNVASACRIRSAIDLSAFEAAWEQLIARHEALRTTFRFEGGHLRRIVHDQGVLDFQVLSAGEDSEDELKARVKAAYQESFDLASGPLLRVRLFRKTEADGVFLIVLHHIVFDAWSLWLLLDEFRLLYAHNVSGERRLLPPLSACYSDYVQSQAALKTSARGETLWQYWQSRLSGELPTLELPSDFPRPLSARLQGASHKFRIRPELTAQLRALAKAQHVTPFMLMLALYQVLLYRYSGQGDLIVGVATSGRTQRAWTDLVGYFVNPLPLRTHLQNDLPFTRYLAQVKAESLGAIEHEEYPFPLLVERLNPPRALGRSPIFSVMFEMRKPQRLQEAMQLFDSSSRPLGFGGLEIHPFDLDQQEGQFDLALELFDTQESYAGILKYNVDLFESQTIERMAEHYEELARAVVSRPELPLGAYEFLPEKERRRLGEYSGRAGTIPPVLAHGLFEEQVQRTPEQVALVCDSTQWTYAMLEKRANQVAQALGSLGVRPGEFVACGFERGIEVAAVLLGIFKAGAVFVPLDPGSPPARFWAIAENCPAKLMITSGPLSAFPGRRMPTFSLASFWEIVTSQAEHSPKVEVSADSLAYVIHTSGSSGLPKGVCVSHQALSAHAVAMRKVLGIRADDRVLQFSNLTFDACLEQMFVPWSLGATLVMRGPELWPPETLWDIVKNERISILHFPPAYLRECLKALPQQPQALDSLRLLISGGDVFPVEILKAFHGRPVQFVNTYGPTESVITATVYDATAHPPSGNPVPIGTPRPHTTAYILDERDRPTPIGIPGELCLGGPLLAEGYLNEPQLTKAKFVPDPFQNTPNARMYRTGDRARWLANGQIEFLGRNDRQIKIQGMRVETAEVENALHSMAGVKAAYVAARVDHNQLTYLTAWVVPEDPRQFQPERLKTGLKDQLPRYMIPRQIVVLEKLPVGSSGKIDVSALPWPDAPPRPSGNEFVPAQTPEEQTLSQIFSDVLQVDSVGVTDNFFDLGGGSLSSLSIVTQARAQGLTLKGEALKPELLFEYPTIKELANYIESQNCESEA